MTKLDRKECARMALRRLQNLDALEDLWPSIERAIEDEPHADPNLADRLGEYAMAYLRNDVYLQSKWERLPIIPAMHCMVACDPYARDAEVAAAIDALYPGEVPYLSDEQEVA
jgi:hypothetical protein